MQYQSHVTRRRGCLAFLRYSRKLGQKEAAEKEKRKTTKDIENENGGAGVYSASLKKHYIQVSASGSSSRDTRWLLQMRLGTHFGLRNHVYWLQVA
ncbi:hypothetical protein CDL15_Pgr018560 [Punica granatum]|uniref:NOG C-terminal domain-containing protein n=1 Tax=Punica granatum TaxID=22663 RepID=A0A218X0K1_PUNGR|nr:hypothetical protein CDL15_Pgr018560 [Punica granatum]PKI69121.1 hypothetical protein CRG98_010476 [Punica granatum]